MNRGNGYVRQPGEALVDVEIETTYHEPHNDWRRDVTAEKMNESNNFTKTFIAVMLIVFATGLVLALIDGWKTASRVPNSTRESERRFDFLRIDDRRTPRDAEEVPRRRL
jgi:hypothetical protein